jgi:hypothetical protein
MPKIYITKCVIHSAIGWSFVGLVCYMVWFLLLIDNLANDSSKMIDKEQRLLWQAKKAFIQTLKKIFLDRIQVLGGRIQKTHKPMTVR